MDLKDAMRAIAGQSPLADDIMKRRYGFSAEARTEPVALATDTSLQDVIEAVLTNVYEPHPNSVEELQQAIIHLATSAELAAEEQQEAENDDAEDKAEAFRLAIQGSRVNDLKCFYVASVFEHLKPATRYTVARTLVEYAESHGKEPAQLWSILVQNNGK